MNAGYVRLSRDDYKKYYVSIENQKMLITRYAAEMGMVIDRWYEDDGVSGYSFNRPGFKALIDDLDNDVDTIFAKDLSRIGRHNARVLLFLDDMKERGKRLLIVDDGYDTINDEDDVIGIKTWYNERYVKDTSKKIRKVVRARQAEGIYIGNVPFGYSRDKNNKNKIIVNTKEAQYVCEIFELYQQGYGYRKISELLTNRGVPTPSMLMSERRLAEGKPFNRQIQFKWSEGMVSDILKNDFYTGTLRQHKRARVSINGTDHRVPKELQNVFYNNHDAIIPKLAYELVQGIMEKRKRSNYRGQSKGGILFGDSLYCDECGSRLTPILRNGRNSDRRYYICSTYNQKGKRYCGHTHMIYEDDLQSDVTKYIKLCRDTLYELIQTYDLKEIENDRLSIDKKRDNIVEAIDSTKKQLKLLLAQKIKDLSSGAEEQVIQETYEGLQNDLLARIHGYELQLNEINDKSFNKGAMLGKLTRALDVIDHIIEKDKIERKDIEIIVERIVVDKQGLPNIVLKYGLSSLVKYDAMDELNKEEHRIILAIIGLIKDEERCYTSAKYLSAQLTKLGYLKSKKSVMPYITLMVDAGILKKTEDKLKPYDIIMNREQINDMLNSYMDTMPGRRDASDGIRVYPEETGNRPKDGSYDYTKH